jgi:hypothetical protein
MGESAGKTVTNIQIRASPVLCCPPLGGGRAERRRDVPRAEE